MKPGEAPGHDHDQHPARPPIPAWVNEEGS